MVHAIASVLYLYLKPTRMKETFVPINVLLTNSYIGTKLLTSLVRLQMSKKLKLPEITVSISVLIQTTFTGMVLALNSVIFL